MSHLNLSLSLQISQSFEAISDGLIQGLNVNCPLKVPIFLSYSVSHSLGGYFLGNYHCQNLLN